MSRAKLVYQWPDAVWPNNTAAAHPFPPPQETRQQIQRVPSPQIGQTATLAACNPSARAQLFTYNASAQTIQHVGA